MSRVAAFMGSPAISAVRASKVSDNEGRKPQTSRHLGLSSPRRTGTYPAAPTRPCRVHDNAVIRNEAVKFWLATLQTRLTLAARIARTVFAPTAVRLVPTRSRGIGSRRSKIDHDPSWPFSLEMGRFAIAEIKNRLVGIADDGVGKVPHKALAGHLQGTRILAFGPRSA